MDVFSMRLSPTAAELAAEHDARPDRFAQVVADLHEQVARCTAGVEAKRAAGESTKAASYALAKWSASRDIAMQLAAGESLSSMRRAPLVAAKTIVDWSTAQDALKASNRLVGLCRAEHEAVAWWLTGDDDDDQALARLEEAHEQVAHAIRQGTPK